MNTFLSQIKQLLNQYSSPKTPQAYKTEGVNTNPRVFGGCQINFIAKRNIKIITGQVIGLSINTF